MWAATQLLDLFCFPVWVLEPSGVALFLSTLGVLAKPSASWRVLPMCAASLVYLYVRSPITPNHILFEGFVNLTILLVALRHWRLPYERARAAAFHEAVPVLRCLLLALYGFAFLHKLNWSFLTPATSCAGFMLEGIAQRLGLPSPPSVFTRPAVWAALFCEGGIPVLLVVPRTRRLAMLLGWPFHFALALHPRPGIYGFSSMLLAMMTLFLPAGFFPRLLSHPLVRRIMDGEHGKRRVRWPWLAAGALGVPALVIATVAVSGLPLSAADLEGWVRRAGMLLWIPYSLMLLAALLAGWPAARGGAGARVLLHVGRSPAVAVLLLFIVNGMAPYLGFQTVRVMSMFSNVRTEGNQTNHLFIPSGLQLADYQDDLVRIVASSDVWLDSYADNESLLPYLELRRRVWEDPDVRVQVTFERDGRIEAVDTAMAGAASRLPPLPFPVHKILAFREVEQDGRPSRCLW
jgi:hypothetical protein